MSSPQNFRSAFNGFHREDVVNYISYLSKKHDTLVAELRAEAEELRSRLEQREEIPDLTEELESLQQQIVALEQEKAETTGAMEELRASAEALENVRGECARLLEENEALKQELARQKQEKESLKQALAQRAAEGDQLKQELEGVKQAAAQQPAANDGARSWSEELNAYRRAERAERRARERVNQMYDQANGALAEASVRMEHSAEDIAALTAKIEADLKLLHQAIAESGTTMADTAVMIGSIRPELD